MKKSHGMMLAAALAVIAGLVPAWSGERKTLGTIERLDPAIDKLIPKDAKLEILAGGFIWVEGPVWIKQGTGGFLAFSDIPNNVVMKWDGTTASKIGRA